MYKVKEFFFLIGLLWMSLANFLSASQRCIQDSMIIHHRVVSHLQRCSRLSELKAVHATVVKGDLCNDGRVATQLLGACSSVGMMDYAVLIFAHIRKPEVYAWNVMIRGFDRCALPGDAVRFYGDMLKSGVRPTSFTFSSVIKACSRSSSLRLGEEIHGHVFKGGFGSEVFVQTSLVDFYSNLGEINRARKVFDEMTLRDAVAWTAMIAGHAKAGDVESARKLFELMSEKSTVSWNTMIAAYARSGDVDAAASLFDSMTNKDLVSWTSMIYCYAQNRCFKKAVMEFERMQMAGVDPDEVTLSTVISACAHLGALEIGKKIHFFISQHEQIFLDVYIGSALIDMYAKCGSIERALLVFFKLHEKNLFCWNSLVEGLAMHGYAVEAIALFRRMEMEKKVIPNGVTFVSVLSACAHAGLVDVGREVFSRMTRIYAIKPEIEHHGCMVDLLSRAGYLEDAMALINDMNMKPNAVIWGALLGGCRTHGNVELGEVAVKNLIILEPLNSGYHVLLANMYAKTNRWTDVAKVRGMMKGKGVQKSPGYSSIMVNGVAHEFLSFDDVHPKCEEIYELLEELGLQLRLAGYVPDLGLT
ncbi:pentatricopeptide repeat-containing protein At1g06143 [Nymphaea colorata]|nr:pentatricopeptide repeat-containing protein At1g06143 [Nymphaea colorata]